MRGQAGVEVLIVVGIIVVLLIPFILGIYAQAQTFGDQVNVNQADRMALTLSEAVDVVVASGEGSNLTVFVTTPANVQEIRAGGREIVIRLAVIGGETEIVKTTRANLTSQNLDRIRSPGTYKVFVAAERSPAGALARIEPA
ncbi:MAG: hypothetical protein QXH27_00345 [Candidatus Micrarchaeia archaeon]